MLSKDEIKQYQNSIKLAKDNYEKAQEKANKEKTEEAFKNANTLARIVRVNELAFYLAKMNAAINEKTFNAIIKPAKKSGAKIEEPPDEEYEKANKNYEEILNNNNIEIEKIRLKANQIPSPQVTVNSNQNEEKENNQKQNEKIDLLKKEGGDSIVAEENYQKLHNEADHNKLAENAQKIQENSKVEGIKNQSPPPQRTTNLNKNEENKNENKEVNAKENNIKKLSEDVSKNINIAPTKEETQEFINKNKSFFTTPLTPKGQKEFRQFYQDADAEDIISNYSRKLISLLYKNTKKIKENTTTPVIYSWLKNDFAPALEHEEVRQFIMDNRDDPAVVMWRNKKPEIELNKPETLTLRKEIPETIQEQPKKVEVSFISPKNENKKELGEKNNEPKVIDKKGVTSKSGDNENKDETVEENAITKSYKEHFKDKDWYKDKKPEVKDNKTHLEFASDKDALSLAREIAENRNFIMVDENNNVLAYSEGGKLYRGDGKEFPKDTTSLIDPNVKLRSLEDHKKLQSNIEHANVKNEGDNNKKEKEKNIQDSNLSSPPSTNPVKNRLNSLKDISTDTTSQNEISEEPNNAYKIT